MEEREAHVRLDMYPERMSRRIMFRKLTDSRLFIPSHFKWVYMWSPAFFTINPSALFHKKRCLKLTMVGKTCFPTALRQLNGMQRKNAFPSHGSLPLQSPYLPPPVRKRKKIVEILSLKTGGSPTRSPGTALGRRRQARRL